MLVDEKQSQFGVRNRRKNAPQPALAPGKISSPHSGVPYDEKILRRMKTAGLKPEDLKETFSRSGGPGGQHVNKVSTACTIRHVPTGVSVTASDSRSQSTNRQLALDRLLDAFEQKRAEKRQERLAAASKARRQKAKRSRATKRKLVEGKRRRGETKKFRGKVRESP